MTLAGCAYSTSGLSTSRIRSVAIPTFETAVFQYGLQEQMTGQLIQAFTADGRLKVVAERDADSVLRGRITGYLREPYQYDSQGHVSQYRVRIVVDVRLEDARRRRTLWEETGLEGWSTYLYDPATEEDARSQAIREATEKLAENVVRRTIEE